MLSIDSRLDHVTMQLIYDTGHSRVPVFEEIEVLTVTEESQMQGGAASNTTNLPSKTQMVKKIVGILLVKQVSSCMM